MVESEEPEPELDAEAGLTAMGAETGASGAACFDLANVALLLLAIAMGDADGGAAARGRAARGRGWMFVAVRELMSIAPGDGLASCWVGSSSSSSQEGF